MHAPERCHCLGGAVYTGGHPGPCRLHSSLLPVLRLCPSALLAHSHDVMRVWEVGSEGFWGASRVRGWCQGLALGVCLLRQWAPRVKEASDMPTSALCPAGEAEPIFLARFWPRGAPLASWALGNGSGVAGCVYLGENLLASGSSSVLIRFPFSHLCTLRPCRAMHHGRVWGAIQEWGHHASHCRETSVSVEHTQGAVGGS